MKHMARATAWWLRVRSPRSPGKAGASVVALHLSFEEAATADSYIKQMVAQERE